ncbi:MULTISPECIES: carbohydrate ABC transporter permease [unclassified Streptomyces]|jgi:multiple sugar transport system permease protein|uniref:carbohydrate ABC transporter permease n=1 Tax=unclassified Streptomyces TaxID=2593676 RepID=UPI0011529C09|nr:carbohydrate ABC transporter permease [Streptomyces sp. SLBN-31]TQJ87945.1 multiple sugar transport system permease protein [Streptomyces sp. SLBN-31]
MTRTPLRRFADYAVLSVLAFVFVLPVLYLILGSFKPSDQVLNGLTGFLPTHLSFDNYRAVLNSFDSDATGYFWRFMGISLLLATVVVFGGLIVNSMAAYGLTRLRWRGQGAVFTVVLLLMLVPFEAVAVPLFYMFNEQRNTVYVQAIPFIANAFSIYQFSTFFRAIPPSIEEAARIDGAGPWRTFFAIVVPMSKPVFASVAILTFLTQWGAFLWPVLMVSDPAVRPLPLEMSVFQGQMPVDWGQVLAFGVLLILPVLIVFAFFQRWFVQGVASSAVKG